MFVYSMQKIAEDKKRAREHASSMLRSALRDNPSVVRTKRCFVVRLPDISEHSNHVVGPVRLVIKLSHWLFGCMQLS